MIRRWKPTTPSDVGTAAPLTRVWVSGTRVIYHRSPNVEGLLEGKQITERKGFRLADVASMTVSRAVQAGCVPCVVCNPPGP